MRVASLTLLMLAASATGAVAADRDMLSEWRELNNDAAAAWYDVPGNIAGPEQQRMTTALWLAIYTAANAVDQSYEQYLEGVEASSDADARLAATAAAARILELAYGDAGKTVAAPVLAEIFTGVDPAVAAASTALGRAAADQAAARARATVDDKFGPYLPQTTPGLYIAARLPAFPPEYFDREPWFLETRDAIRPGPPPDLSSDLWAENYNEVKRLGRLTGSDRTPEQSREATFWTGQDNEMVIDQAATRRDLSLTDTARIYALIAMSTDDSMLAVVEAKYHYNWWRPITAIRRAELDGNDGTEADPWWEPYQSTPNHPEYPCAHCQYGAGTSAILEATMPEMEGETFRVYDWKTPDDFVELTAYDQFRERMSMSRIYYGAHYRHSNETGEAMGQAVAAMALGYFEALE